MRIPYFDPAKTLEIEKGTSTVLTFQLDQGDYRKPHTCKFFQVSGGQQETQVLEQIGTFKGKDKVECRFKSNQLSEQFHGQVYATILINGVYFTNFVQIEAVEVSKLVEVSPPSIHLQKNQPYQTDLLLTFQGSGLASSLLIDFDGIHYTAVSLKETEENTTVYMARVKCNPQGGVPATKSQEIKVGLNPKSTFIRTGITVEYKGALSFKSMEPVSAQTGSSATLVQFDLKNLALEQSYYLQVSDAVEANLNPSEQALNSTYLTECQTAQVTTNGIQNKLVLQCEIKPRFEAISLQLTLLANSGNYQLAIPQTFDFINSEASDSEMSDSFEIESVWLNEVTLIPNIKETIFIQPDTAIRTLLMLMDPNPS